MKKNILKTSLVAGSLLAFGFAIMSSINPANTAKADTETGSGTAKVEITVERGDVTIGLSGDVAPTASGLIFTGIKVSNDPQVLTGSFGEDSFWINDQAGTLSGYYTTLSVTNLSGTNHPENAIPASNVKFIASGSINVITGMSNSEVKITAFESWTTSTKNDVKNFFTRQNTGAGILGMYGTNLGVEVTVPEHTIADTYVGTITYTLYDLDPEITVAP